MLAVVFVRIDLKRRVYRSQYLSGLESRMARFLDLRKKNDKLISAQAAYCVGGAYTTQQAFYNRLEHLVSECVSRRIINLLELIQIQK